MTLIPFHKKHYAEMQSESHDDDPLNIHLSFILHHAHTGSRPQSQGFVLYVYLHFAGNLSITSHLRFARCYSFAMGKLKPKEPQN